MTSWRDKLALTAQRNRQEIVKAKLNRREMMRLGLLTAGGSLIAKAGLSARAFAAQGSGDTGSLTVPGVDGQSPPITPWKVPMPRLTVLQTVLNNDPHNMEFGVPDGTTPVDGATRRVAHQYFCTTPPPTRSAPAARAASSRRNSTRWTRRGLHPAPSRPGS